MILRMLLTGLCLVVAQAQGVPSQRGLEGVQLGQYLDAVEATFPKVKLERTSEDQWVTKAFYLPSTKGVFIAVQCPPSEHRRIESIQISGDPKSGHSLFAGLRMGMGESEISKILGRPSDRRPY